jgi:hypothetical protein
MGDKVADNKVGAHHTATAWRASLCARPRFAPGSVEHRGDHAGQAAPGFRDDKARAAG